MGVITTIGKLLLKNKKGTVGVIKSVKPFSKTGAHSVSYWKNRMDLRKAINKPK